MSPLPPLPPLPPCSPCLHYSVASVKIKSAKVDAHSLSAYWRNSTTVRITLYIHKCNALGMQPCKTFSEVFSFSGSYDLKSAMVIFKSILQYFCLKIARILSCLKKKWSNLATKCAWVRPENRSELCARNEIKPLFMGMQVPFLQATLHITWWAVSKTWRSVWFLPLPLLAPKLVDTGNRGTVTVMVTVVTATVTV